MKTPIVVAVNAAVAVAAILVYDALRDTESAPPAAQEAPIAAAIEQRLAALESRIDALAAQGGDRRSTSRLAQIEDRLAAVESKDAAAAAAAEAEPAPDTTTPQLVEKPGDEFSPEEVARFRRLAERVEADRERERTAAALDGVLQRLGLNLTAAQKERLAAEVAAFRAQQRERMMGGGGPAAVRSRDDVMASLQEAQANFTKKLEEFLPAGDAAAIAGAIPMFVGRGGPPPR